MDTILIVEDDRALAQGLARALTTDQIQTQTCFSIREAKKRLAADRCDLVILDVNLPDGNGFDLLQTIRQDRSNPCRVIMLTANDLESDIVTGLEQGADDYVTKPFSLAVLRARVGTQLRKRREKPASGHPYRSGGYVFDFEHMEFTNNGEPVTLSKTEQKLLRILVENPGITLSRDRLLDAVWTDGAAFVEENALSVTVKRLRDKLGAADRIRTVYGIGYVWEADA